MKINKHQQRFFLAVIAILLGVGLIIGESIRSYGQGRPFFAWFDDFIMAFFLFFAAYQALQRPQNIKYLSAAFGICVAALGMSYLSKVLNPNEEVYSNVSFGLLTTALLVAWIASFVCMAWTLAADFQDSE